MVSVFLYVAAINFQGPLTYIWYRFLDRSYSSNSLGTTTTCLVPRSVQKSAFRPSFLYSGWARELFRFPPSFPSPVTCRSRQETLFGIQNPETNLSRTFHKPCCAIISYGQQSRPSISLLSQSSFVLVWSASFLSDGMHIYLNLTFPNVCRPCALTWPVVQNLS